MPTLPARHKPKGQQDRQDAKRDHDQRRGSARQRGYTGKWEKARAAYLREHQLCRMCDAEGRVTIATVVDHIVPHRGDDALFWDRTNWQPLCKPHHDREKQRQERGGR